MKKTRLLLLAVAIFVGNLAMAQTTPFVQIKFGSTSLHSSLDTEDYVARFSYGLGVGAEIAMSENFFIRPSLVYMSRGFGVKSTVNSSAGVSVAKDLTLNMTSLEIPVNFIYKFGDASKNTRFFLGAGPNLGFRLGGKRTGSIITTTNGTSVTQNIDDKPKYGKAPDEYASTFFSISALGGIEFANQFSVGIEWIGDLGNAYNVDFQTTAARYVGLRLGFFFGGSGNNGDY